MKIDQGIKCWVEGYLDRLSKNTPEIETKESDEDEEENKEERGDKGRRKEGRGEEGKATITPITNNDGSVMIYVTSNVVEEN